MADFHWGILRIPDFGSSATCPEAGQQSGKIFLVVFRDACACVYLSFGVCILGFRSIILYFAN